jgi:hypothetical protein
VLAGTSKPPLKDDRDERLVRMLKLLPFWVRSRPSAGLSQRPDQCGRGHRPQPARGQNPDPRAAALPSRPGAHPWVAWVGGCTQGRKTPSGEITSPRQTGEVHKAIEL